MVHDNDAMNAIIGTTITNGMVKWFRYNGGLGNFVIEYLSNGA